MSQVPRGGRIQNAAEFCLNGTRDILRLGEHSLCPPILTRVPNVCSSDSVETHS